jgi:hypothetical protein
MRIRREIFNDYKWLQIIQQMAPGTAGPNGGQSKTAKMRQKMVYLGGATTDRELQRLHL